MKLTPCCCCWRVCTNVLPLNDTQKSAQERKRETRLSHQNSLASEGLDDDARTKLHRSQEKQRSAELGERGSERNQRVSNFGANGHISGIFRSLYSRDQCWPVTSFINNRRVGFWEKFSWGGGVETSHVINIKKNWVTTLGYQNLGNTHLLHKGELSNNWFIFAYYSCRRFFKLKSKLYIFY